jgi:hypothetical protein
LAWIAWRSVDRPRSNGSSAPSVDGSILRFPGGSSLIAQAADRSVADRTELGQTLWTERTRLIFLRSSPLPIPIVRSVDWLRLLAVRVLSPDAGRVEAGELDFGCGPDPPRPGALRD